jgi:hypothetical protein
MHDPHFKQYGKQFQEKIFQGLLTDRSWATQMIEIMSPTFFELKYLHFLTQRYFDYYQKYKDFPTLSLLVTIIRDDLKEGKDIVLRDQIVEFLQRIRVNPAAIQLTLDPANHDFGYAVHRQGDPQALYLVVETKGYENRARIEGEERLKVDSAKKFFEASKAEGVPVEFVSKINGEKLGSLVAGILHA